MAATDLPDAHTCPDCQRTVRLTPGTSRLAHHYLPVTPGEEPRVCGGAGSTPVDPDSSVVGM